MSPHAAYLALADSTVERAGSYAALCNGSLEQNVLDDIRKATRGATRWVRLVERAAAKRKW